MNRKLPVILLLSSLYCSFHEDELTDFKVTAITDKETNRESLNRNKRDFHNTINKIPEIMRHEMIHQRKFLLQNKGMCSQIPCQRIPFLISYQVSCKGKSDKTSSFRRQTVNRLFRN